MRIKRCQHLVLPVLAFLFVQMPVGLPAQDTFSNAIMQAHAIIQTEIAPKVPGVSVAVAVDGKIVWSEEFGYADLSAKTPVTPETRFRIGSVSKSLTSVGLALLVERGALDMDAPIQKYIPDYPTNGGTLTLRLLAGHLSGIRNYHGNEIFSNRPYPDLRAGLKIFENDPLLSPPGTKFSYASFNWNVIGVAMEAAAKQDFLKYMDNAVLKPLNLTNTVPDRAGAVDPQRTEFYEAGAAGKYFVAPKVDLSYAWPSGGYLSTAEDLVRFGSALLQPGFLKPESRRMLFTSQATADGKLTHYGVGWFAGRVAYHTGDSIGGSAILMLDPASRTVVAILTNRGHLAFQKEDGRVKLIKMDDSFAFNRVKIAADILKLFAADSAEKK